MTPAPGVTPLDQTTFQQILLEEIRYIRDQVDSHRDDHHALKNEVEGLKVRTGIISALIGALTGYFSKLFT